MFRYLMAGALALTATTAAAETTIYECTFAKENGYMMSPVVIAVEEAKKEATAADPFILHFESKPKTVSIVADKPAKRTFSWKVKIQNASGQYTTMAYRASVINGRQFVMTANPLGYSNSFRGDGSCKVSKKK